MPKDLMFHYTSLFSQDLSSLEPILRETSCMNPDDAELIGLCYALQMRLIQKGREERAKRIKAMLPMLEAIGMSKWVKGEVTQLGLRLGHRNKANIELSSDIEEINTDGADSTT